MKNIFATISFLFLLSVCSFGQIKFDDAFKISKKKRCYDLNIEKIDFSNKKNSDNTSKTFKVKILLSNIGNMKFEQTQNAYLELYDISGDSRIKLDSWEFNNFAPDHTETFEWEQIHFPEDQFPTNVEAKIVLNGTFGECSLFNNSRMKEYEW